MNDECIYTYAYQRDNSSLIFSTAIFNAFSLAAVRSISFHFQRDTTVGQGVGKLSWRRAPTSKRDAKTQPSILFFRRGKLSLPTGQEATNRAQRPRWWLISVHGNEPCYQELISPAYCHLLVVLSRRRCWFAWSLSFVFLFQDALFCFCDFQYCRSAVRSNYKYAFETILVKRKIEKRKLAIFRELTIEIKLRK